MKPFNWSHSFAEYHNLLEQNQHNFRLKSLFTPSFGDRRLLAELIIQTDRPHFSHIRSFGNWRKISDLWRVSQPFRSVSSLATGWPTASLKSATGSYETVARGDWTTTPTPSLPHSSPLLLLSGFSDWHQSVVGSQRGEEQSSVAADWHLPFLPSFHSIALIWGIWKRLLRARVRTDRGELASSL